jgi:ankyrin repeat protein
VRADDIETSRMLLNAGANAKAANRYGITPLSLAATNANAGMIEALLKAGADPRASLPGGETVLMTAAHTGNPEAVQALLDHGADANARENTYGETALMWAAAENHAAAVKVLQPAGLSKGPVRSRRRHDHLAPRKLDGAHVRGAARVS